MSSFAYLLTGSAASALLIPRALAQATRSERAPRLVVAAWATAAVTVSGAWLSASVLLMAALVGGPASIPGRCLGLLGVPELGGAWLRGVLLALIVGLLAATGGRAGRRGMATRRRARRYVDIARIAGRRVPGVDAYIVDSDRAAAYCLPGRGRTIVLSTAAVAALSAAQLAAVITHEQAHLRGRHHLLLGIASIMRSVFPAVPLFSIGAREVARLVELCADDVAVRRHGRGAVIGALAALAGAGAPAGGLAAGGSSADARIARLARGEHPDGCRRSRQALVLVGAALLIGPAATVYLATGALAACGVPFA
jgi:Zn-dependent protease with chaperone function